MVVVTDESTAAEIATAIGHVCERAKRAQTVIGTADYPSAWDRSHEALDQLLCDRERLTH